MSAAYDGVVTGGWGFVWLSYGIAGLAVLLLVIGLVWRLYAVKARLAALEDEGDEASPRETNSVSEA